MQLPAQQNDASNTDMPDRLHALLHTIFLLILFSCSSNVHLGEEYKQRAARSQQLFKSTAVNSHLIFEETFEGRVPFASAHLIEVGPWSYALQYVKQPVFEGRKAVRFEIRRDQPLVKNGKRAEVCIVKGADGNITRETWYSFMVYCP